MKFEQLKNNIIKGEPIQNDIILSENQIIEILNLNKLKGSLWISRTQKLSENLISKYYKKLSMTLISQYQQLSLKFITRFKDKLNMNCICKYQKLSAVWIELYKDYINFRAISENTVMSDNEYQLTIVRNFNNKFINWIEVSRRSLYPEFITKCKDKLILSLLSLYNNDILLRNIYGVEYEELLDEIESRHIYIYQKAMEDVIKYNIENGLYINHSYLKNKSKDYPMIQTLLKCAN